MSEKETYHTKYRGPEVRSTGRQIDYSGRIENVIDAITNVATEDQWNDITAFNKYERLVKRFERIMRGYYDDSYLEEIRSLDYENKTWEHTINLLDRREAALYSLLKRKGFTPADDTRDNSFIIVRNITTRVRDELDAQIIVFGDRGSGKSTLTMEIAVEIAEEMGLSWDVNKHLFFDSYEMRNYIYNNKPLPGQPLIWDEAGAGKGMGKRRAMTKESIEYYEIIQLIREMGLVLFYTAPADTDLDSGTINMFSGKIETIKLDKLEKVNVVKYLERRGKDIWQYPTDPHKNRITQITISKAPGDIIRQYKKRKREHMYEKVKVKPEEKKVLKPKADPDKIKKTIKANKDLYTKEWRGKTLVNGDIMYEDFKETENLTYRQAMKIKKELEAELNG